MKRVLSAGLLALAAACAPATTTAPPAESTAAAPAPAPIDVSALPSGEYKLDKAHAALTFRVNHLGFSHYTAQFTRFDATLQLDPAHPEAATLTATIDPRSLSLPNPPTGFQAELLSANWLNAAQFPQMTFRSTAIEKTGPNTARVTGDFTLHGQTKPVTLDVTFNGGWPGMAMDPHARIGFSAHGTLNRSDYGIAFGIPPEGTNMGVSDAVEITIEAEFTGPAWTPPAEGATPAQ